MLTEEHQRHTQHVEQSQGCENSRWVKRMINPVDDERDDAGQDG